VGAVSVLWWLLDMSMALLVGWQWHIMTVGAHAAHLASEEAVVHLAAVTPRRHVYHGTANERFVRRALAGTENVHVSWLVPAAPALSATFL
jgi:hypothetical protein